jgi:hypothetical protein
LLLLCLLPYVSLVSFLFFLKLCSFKTCFDTGGDQLGGCFGDQRWMAWSLLWDLWCLGLNPFCIHITQWGNVEVITPKSNDSIELFTLKSKFGSHHYRMQGVAEAQLLYTKACKYHSYFATAADFCW